MRYSTILAVLVASVAAAPLPAPQSLIGTVAGLIPGGSGGNGPTTTTTTNNNSPSPEGNIGDTSLGDFTGHGGSGNPSFGAGNASGDSDNGNGNPLSGNQVNVGDLSPTVNILSKGSP
ncbi:uncharacterized protein SEPMUDRAFT_145639 [Sphaerulina musiva SO2202]|uniref:Uncharacterized protein n=1 Tax=Sphaerulina musiva (strain SO2202) TaxID=692275 RepID=N1QL88_SPHMS|nr:uncharacterized protein SEPMUDRAFT_145639 [Sphaerulina musiva SO2202]EMF16383.1 hypothetical protein SEPMUDRAFT_145639 [Sphaerulina musiva SO2202]